MARLIPTTHHRTNVQTGPPETDGRGHYQAYCWTCDWEGPVRQHSTEAAADAREHRTTYNDR